MSNKVKILFFGTSEFAIPALRALHGSGFNVVTVVTQPDKPAGRKLELSPSPVKLAAQDLGLKVLQPDKLTVHSTQVTADLFVVASYGKIIPDVILQMPRLGALNIHPSLLPKYRGPSPIQTAILNGDKETGVTIIKLDEEMDHGPVIADFRFKISDSRLGYKELHDQLAETGAELLIKILPDYLAGKIKHAAQDDTKATFTKIISKDDAKIDWKKSAQEIDRIVRAYSDWPVAWTMLEGKRLKIYEAAPVSVIPASEPPASLSLKRGEESREWIAGQVRDGKEGKIVIRTGAGLLELCSLQLEGRKKMTAEEFVRGYPNLTGCILKS